MQILDQLKLWEDEFKEEHSPLLATEFGRGIALADDDAYYTIVQSGSMQTTCIPIQQEDIWDTTTPATSSATICTLAIRAGLSPVPIPNIVWAIDESIWVDDYSDEKALEIKTEPRKNIIIMNPCIRISIGYIANALNQAGTATVLAPYLKGYFLKQQSFLICSLLIYRCPK